MNLGHHSLPARATCAWHTPRGCEPSLKSQPLASLAAVAYICFAHRKSVSGRNHNVATDHLSTHPACTPPWIVSLAQWSYCWRLWLHHALHRTTPRACSCHRYRVTHSDLTLRVSWVQFMSHETYFEPNVASTAIVSSLIQKTVSQINKPMVIGRFRLLTHLVPWCLHRMQGTSRSARTSASSRQLWLRVPQTMMLPRRSTRMARTARSLTAACAHSEVRLKYGSALSPAGAAA